MGAILEEDNLKLKRPEKYYLVYIVGAVFIVTRAVLDSQFSNSSLLYIGVPFLVSFLLYHFSQLRDEQTRKPSFLRHIRDATIIFFATSAFLFEGFICVVFFMPIYYFVCSLTFFFRWLAKEHDRQKKNRLKSSVLPVIILIMSLEGTSPSTSFERHNTIISSIIVEADVSAIKANLAKPFELPSKRHWFLSIFPLPTKIQSGSLEENDIHKVTFVYKRWFFTNIHEGEFHVRIDEVNETSILTSVTRDTSYLANYLNLKGSNITFEEIADNRTRVSLAMTYDRLLDPTWYFDPLQKYAVQKSGEYFIKTVFAGGAMDE